MSYQLIYTSAAELLEPGMAGYGVVACSTDIPRQLYNRILDISDLREPAGKGIIGPQYTYHLLETTGKTYHVLSCLQPAGADYSGRGCHIAHHLALSQEEAHAMASHALRPTPAGMMLALCRAGFWRRSWVGSPQYLNGEPNLTPSMLPDASTQTTWKLLTGHKRNARILNLAPYDHSCLLAVPEGTSSETLLGLLHESDWILTSCGWGKSFTTYASPEDSFRDTLRMFTTHGSALEERVRRSGRPVLAVNSRLPVPEETTRETSASRENAPSLSPVSLSSGGTASHYRYVEADDEDSYHLPKPAIGWGRAAALAGGLLLAAGVYLWQQQEPQEALLPPPPAPKEQPPPSPLPDLSALVSSPFQEEQLLPLLEQWNERLSGQLKKSPSTETAVRQEVVSLLLQAPGSSHHARDLQRLAECTRTVNLPKAALCFLYLNLAYQAGSAESLAANCSPESQGEWAQLQRLEPELVQELLQSGQYTPYLSLVLPEQGQAAPLPEPSPAPTEVPDAPQAALPLALSPGAPLPAPFLSLLRQLPLTVDTGDYTVCRWGHDVSKASVAKTYHLSPEYCQLVLEEGRREGQYVATLVQHGRKDKAPVRFFVKGNTLQSLEQEGEPVAISLSLPPTADRGPVQLAMVSQLQFYQKRRATPLPPVLERSPVLVEPQYIEIIRQGNQVPRLRYKAPATLPWCPYSLGMEEQKPLIAVLLPQLVPAGNRVMPDQKQEVPGQALSWRLAPASRASRPGWEWHHCLVSRDYDFSGLLHSQFDKIANTPFFGKEPEGDPRYTLAHVYALVSEMDHPNTSKKAWNQAAQRYIHICSNPNFAALLRFILLRDHQLVPDRNISGMQRQELLKKLANPATRDYILQALRSELQEQLGHAYRKTLQRDKLQKDVTLRLELDHLSTSAEGALIWHFNLTPDSARP